MFKYIWSFVFFSSLLLSQSLQNFVESDWMISKSSSQSTSSVQDGDFEVIWSWDTGPQWLSDVSGNINTGEYIFGSTIPTAQVKPVKIIFSRQDTTSARTYRRDQSYQASGVGIFYGSAWDMSDENNPRRLNICFVEDMSSGNVNLEWDPIATSLGGREYLFIMQSDYDGTGQTYNEQNNGTVADVLYFCWLRVPEGKTLYQSDPSELNIAVSHINGFYALPDVSSNFLQWKLVDGNGDELRLYGGTSSPPDALLAELPVNARSYLHENLTENTTYYYRIDLYGNDTLISSSRVLESKAQNVSLNMNLIGNISPYSEYGDIWGYTDQTNGKEYALLCARFDGLSIIDITVSPPVEVGFEPSISPNVDSKDVKVYKNWAILINENDVAQIIDLKDPANPSTVKTIAPGGGGAHNCYVDGDYLYIVGNHGIGGLEIYNISNPLEPDKVGTFEPFYYHDLYVKGNIGYAAGIYGDGVDILDLSDKTSPKLIKRFNYAGSGAHNVWPTEDGNYIFVGDEIGSAGQHTRVFDISDTDNIEKVADIIVDAQASTHNCYVKGDLLYIGHYTEGIQVYDISDPVHPKRIAYYDTFLPDIYGYDGVWSVYPYFESGKIIVSDMLTGLYVFELDEKATTIKKDVIDLPNSLVLEQNYPNPFNPVTKIGYSIGTKNNAAVFVDLSVYNLLGQKVATLVSTKQRAGSYQVEWDASGFASGVYIYTLETSTGFMQHRKLILLK